MCMLSPEDIDGMITEANKDSTGLITLQEFVKVIQRTVTIIITLCM